jgi:hypothetical protein
MKSAKRVTKSKNKGKKLVNRGWGQTFSFLKTPKIEPPRETIYGSVYFALRKLKSGTVDELTEEAMRQGLNKVTKQDPRIQTQVMLRRLVHLGTAKKERPGKDKKSSAPTKKVKLFRVKKVAAVAAE